MDLAQFSVVANIWASISSLLSCLVLKFDGLVDFLSIDGAVLCNHSLLLISARSHLLDRDVDCRHHLFVLVLVLQLLVKGVSRTGTPVFVFFILYD